MSAEMKPSCIMKQWVGFASPACPLHKITDFQNHSPATCSSVTMDVLTKYCLYQQFTLEPIHTPCKFHNINQCFSSNKAHALMFLFNRCVAEMIIMYGIERRAMYIQVQGNYGRLKLWHWLYAYIITSFIEIFSAQLLSQSMYIIQHAGVHLILKTWKACDNIPCTLLKFTMRVHFVHFWSVEI